MGACFCTEQLRGELAVCAAAERKPNTHFTSSGEEHASRRPWYDPVSLAVCLWWCELCLGPTEVEVPPCYCYVMKMIDSDSHLP